MSHSKERTDMKKLIIAISLIVLASCEKQLDIIPKGKTTLNNLNDLELLLNGEMSIETPFIDLSVICNESLGMCDKIPDVLSQSNTLKYAYLTYNEDVNRVNLSLSGGRYSEIYRIINYMNTILEKIDGVPGDENRKAVIAAEARIIRAYMHYLLVNIYAKQFDEATAATEGGVPYVTDTKINTTKVKLTVAETYRLILEDCKDEVIELLPETNVSVFRATRAFGYGVRAKVLLQMKRYAEALPYAQKALELNGAIDDRSYISSEAPWNLPFESKNNYLYIRGTSRAAPFMEVLSFETKDKFDPDDYNLQSTDWVNSYGMTFTGLSGCYVYMGMNAAANEWGLTSDRMYYTAAECLIRTGLYKDGLELVDMVRAKRIRDYEPFATREISTEKEAMSLFQEAKWIECLATYENYFDCKRWNTESSYKRKITRTLGKYGSYSIEPDSPLWVMPFPANATRHNKTLTQNF